MKDFEGAPLGIATRPDDIIDFWKATTLRAYLVALNLEGISEKDVEFVELPRLGNSFDTPRSPGQGNGPADDLIEVQALKSGKVDAIFHKGSRGVEIASAIGAHTVFDVWNHPDPRARANNHSPRTFTIDANLADHHPDIAARVVKQAILAGRWAEEHPVEAIQYLARETGSTEHWVKQAYGPNVHTHLKTDLEESSNRCVGRFHELPLRRGFLPNQLDVRSWIDPRPLAAARRELAGQATRRPAAENRALGQST